MSVKVRVREGDGYGPLELESGETYLPGSVQTLHLRKEVDPGVVRAYEQGQIEILEGGERLRERADSREYELREEHWQSLVNEIRGGDHDDRLEEIVSRDDRDSVVSAAQERLETLQEEDSE